MIHVRNFTTVYETVVSSASKNVLSLGICPDELRELPNIDLLFLEFADIDRPSSKNLKFAASDQQIWQLISLCKRWDGQGPLVINCRQGHRRSPAAAYIALCILGQYKEVDCMAQLRLAAPYAEPNRWMVQLADHLLAREGRMVAALDSMPATSNQILEGFQLCAGKSS